mgnify:CR=1 FL=1
MRKQVEEIAAKLAATAGRVTVLTGAGVSAESGIPTFRGEGGFWTVGSVNYRPEDLATRQHFSRDPGVVWPWYLYRLRVCREAQPNSGHRALVQLEHQLGDRFRLVTQNVDGLHVRAGSHPEATFHIHGNLERVRCAASCTRETQPISPQLRPFGKGEALTTADRELLTCGNCGAWLRPHVLWFDEMYDEEWFRYESSRIAAWESDLLLVIGTSGETNLPVQMGDLAQRSGSIVVDMNLFPSPFTQIAVASGGCFAQGKAGDLLPLWCETLGALAAQAAPQEAAE